MGTEVQLGGGSHSDSPSHSKVAQLPVNPEGASSQRNDECLR